MPRATPRFGPYELRGQLGQGGGGSIFRAFDPRLGREVALKLLTAPAHGDAGQAARERFRREAEALARLHHPNVVRVHAAGEEQGRPYLVMDLIGGEDLERRLHRTGPWPAGDAARLLATLTGAVEHAHAQGIVHRDLKPANVLLAEDGRVLLTDFGLARDLDPDLSGTRLTKDGRFLGTPGYWPPEQAQGQTDRIGPRSDVYGLGAILYALLTGEPPHQGDSLPALIVAASGPPRPPSLRVPGLPQALDAICLTALAPAPEERYASAAALGADLERFLAGEAVSARAPRARGARVRVLALVVLAGSGLFAWSARPGQAPRLGAEPPQRGASSPTPGPATDAATAEPPLVEWLRLDAAAVRGGRLPRLDTLFPGGLRCLGDAIRLRAVGLCRPLLQAPIAPLAGRFLLQASVEVTCLDGSPFLLALDRRDADGVVLRLERLRAPDDPTRPCRVALEVAGGGIVEGLGLEPVTGRLDCFLEGRPGERVSARLEQAGRVLWTGTAPLPSAVLELVRCELGGPTRGALDSWSQVLVQALVLSGVGAPGELAYPGAEGAPTLLAAQAWLTGAPRAPFAASYDESWGTRPAPGTRSLHGAGDLAVLRSLAEAHLGQPDEALARLLATERLITSPMAGRVQGPSGQRRWLGHCAHGLDDPVERRVMSRYAAWLHEAETPAQLRDAGRALTAAWPQDDPVQCAAEAALLFELVPAGKESASPYEEAEARLWAGDPERALEFLDPMAQLGDSDSRALAALAAARLGREEQASGYLVGTPPAPNRPLARLALERARGLLGAR